MYRKSRQGAEVHTIRPLRIIDKCDMPIAPLNDWVLKDKTKGKGVESWSKCFDTKKNSTRCELRKLANIESNYEIGRTNFF